MLTALRRDLRARSDPKKAAFFPRFFRTGKGEYGEGDRFIGVTVPQIRMVAKAYADLPLTDIKQLLASPIHEERLTALIILVWRYQTSKGDERERVVRFYLSHLKGVNNWDLVDSSAHQILGMHCLQSGDTSILEEFAKTSDLWKQRIAMVATYAFIRDGKLGPTFTIADMLIAHPHDLIHKAVGWMLREAGKRDETLLKKYLARRYKHMPRTMLRYAIEKFDAAERQRYLKGNA